MATRSWRGVALFFVLLATIGGVPTSRRGAPANATSGPPHSSLILQRDLDRDGVIDNARLADGRLTIRASAAGEQVIARVRGQALSIADIDTDGDADLVVLSRRGVLRVWLNNGAGAFAAAPVVIRPAARSTLSAPTRVGSDGREEGVRQTAHPQPRPEMARGSLPPANWLIDTPLHRLVAVSASSDRRDHRAPTRAPPVARS